MTSSLVQQLDQQARVNVPPINPHQSPKEYFGMAAGYLREAGGRKQAGDIQGAYMHLFMYFVLIMERIPSHPRISEHNDEYYFNCERCAGIVSQELKTLRETLEPPKQSGGGWLGGWFGGSNSSSSQSPTSPTPQKSLPPVPHRNNQQYNSTASTFQERAVESVVMNERVQENVGRGVASMAVNSKVQGAVGNSVANAAQNRQYQSMLGNSIAENSDNALVKNLAKNETVQRHVGTAISKTAGNKEVQQKVGSAIASAATNKEVQRKVASGLLGAAKLGWSATKTGAGLAVQGGKVAYTEYQKQQAEEQNQ